MSIWLGVDFSGNHLMWRQRCRRSNVWVASVEGDVGTYRLRALRTVQDLAGDKALIAAIAFTELAVPGVGVLVRGQARVVLQENRPPRQGLGDSLVNGHFFGGRARHLVLIG